MPSNVSEENWLSFLCGPNLQAGRHLSPFHDTYFSICIENTLLIWVPCGLLWLCSLPYIILLHSTPRKPIPWTLLTNFKLVIFLILLGASTVQLVSLLDLTMVGYSIPRRDLFATVILMATYILETILTLKGRWFGRRNGVLQLFYWFMMVICGLSRLRTIISGKSSLLVSTVLAATYFLQYGGAVLLFTANCFADNPTLYPHEISHPEQRASFLSQITFYWCGNLVWRGWKRPLMHNSLWKLPLHCSALYCLNFWNNACKRYSSLSCKFVVHVASKHS